MRELTITRRRALGGLAAAGAASATAGVGTTAFLNDTETFSENSVVAGELDLKVAWRKTVDQGDRRIEETSGSFPTPTNDADAPICDLTDLKPGDSGHVEFVLRIDGNPGYVSLLGAQRRDEENGQPEPERGALSESIPPGAEGELDEFLTTTVWYGPTDGGTVTARTPAYTTSLASLVDLGSVGTGLPLDGAGTTPVADMVLDRATQAPLDGGTTYGLRIDWELPRTVGNGVQSDSYEFALGVYGEQARHNDP